MFILSENRRGITTEYILNEDEYCLLSLLKAFVTRKTLAEQRRTLSSTGYQQLCYQVTVSVKTNPNHCLIMFKKSSLNLDPLPH